MCKTPTSKCAKNVSHSKIDFVYIKFWRQACLPSLLFGSELFTVTPNLLHKLERCQMWFLKIIFFVPKFAPNLLILQLAGLNSIESEIDIRKLLFLGCLLTEPKMTFVVKSLFQSRAASYFDPNIKSIGVLPSICDTLCKYNLSTLKLGFTTLSFLVTRNGSQLFTMNCVTAK